MCLPLCACYLRQDRCAHAVVIKVQSCWQVQVFKQQHLIQLFRVCSIQPIPSMPSVIAAAATKKRLKNYLCAVAVLRDMALATWSPPFSNCPLISLASPSLMPVCLAFVVFVRSFYRTNICILMCTCVIMFVLGVGFPDTDENLEYDQILRKVRPLFIRFLVIKFRSLFNLSMFLWLETSQPRPLGKECAWQLA